MNVLIVNTGSIPVKSDLINIFIKNQYNNYIVILNPINNGKSISRLPLEINFSNNVVSLTVDFSNSTHLKPIIQELFSKFVAFSAIIYIEEIPKTESINFVKLSLESFKNFYLSEIQKKISFFQFIIREIKKQILPCNIVVLLPEISQTKHFRDNITQSILLSSFNMLTTAFSDEFIDFDIYCNAIVFNDEYLKTLTWLLFEQKPLYHGKLFQNKQIIEW